jgi:7-cyano-7-deazaguanine synthase
MAEIASLSSIVFDRSRPAIVLLSGGMDSTVAAYWGLNLFSRLSALHVDYHQKSGTRERTAADDVWAEMRHDRPFVVARLHLHIGSLFMGPSSLTHSDVPIDWYKDEQEAVAKTSSDRSYIPMRNVQLVALAAHYLLLDSPGGGYVIIGTRGRSDGPGGFPDCTPQFAAAMTAAMTTASGVPIGVLDPLNYQDEPGRVGTIRLAEQLGAMKALAHTWTCFTPKRFPCGHCLPCLRRAAAFNAAGTEDPYYVEHPYAIGHEEGE